MESHWGKVREVKQHRPAPTECGGKKKKKKKKKKNHYGVRAGHELAEASRVRAGTDQQSESWQRPAE